MKIELGRLGIIVGTSIGVLAFLGLMTSGGYADDSTLQTWLIVAAVIFGSGLIAGAIQKRGQG